MDALKAIGGTAVGCLAAFALLGVAVLGFGYFACRTHEGVRRAVATSREIHERVSVTVESVRTTDGGDSVECSLRWENLTEHRILLAAGSVQFQTAAGEFVYAVPVDLDSEIPPKSAVAQLARGRIIRNDRIQSPPRLETLRPVFIGKRVALSDGTLYESAF
jgi:hypothetical protein